MKLGYSYPNRTKVFFDIMIIFFTCSAMDLSRESICPTTALSREEETLSVTEATEDLALLIRVLAFSEVM